MKTEIFKGTLMTTALLVCTCVATAWEAGGASRAADKDVTLWGVSFAAKATVMIIAHQRAN